MANIRIKDLSTTASTTASDDFFGVDGATNGTRKLNAYSPTFGGNLTVSGGTITGGSILSFATATGDADNSIAYRFLNAAATTAGRYTGIVVGRSIAVGGSGVLGVVSDTTTPANSWMYLANYGDIETTNSLRVLKGGNVSIGQALTVGGNLTVSGTGTSNVGGTLVVGSTSAASGSGKLELATHTTSAGGIGFGTDTSLYRASDGHLWINTASGNNPALKLSIAGTQYAWLEYYSPDNSAYLTSATGKALAFRTNGSTTALTLDSSQNATFAGRVGVAGGSGVFVGTTSDYGIGGSIYQDSGSPYSTHINGYSLEFGTGGNYARTTRLTINNSGDATFAGTVIANKATTAFRIPTAETPASASATGTVGTITWDSSYIYVCTATNTWKRVAIATWP